MVKPESLEKAHFVTQKIEKEIRRTVPRVDHILIHYEPQKKETTTWAVPLSEDRMVLAEHFGNARYFYVATRRERDGMLVSEAYLHNPFGEDEKGKGIKISEWLLEKGIDRVYTPRDLKGTGPGYVFSDAGVEVIVSGDKALPDIQKDLEET
jgi:predicted Fe-Mo cluster-binding NifX family protein